MNFASDNASPAHPRVLEALTKANQGHMMPYGDDPIMGEVREQIRTLFEAPNAAVYLVATGTAANALALSSLCSPWHTIYCSDKAHIQIDECNAPEFFTGGAKLTLVDGSAGKFSAEALQRTISAGPVHGLHGAQRGPVSITQVSDCGTVFTVDEIAALTAVARAHGLKFHMDGARFANATVALGCTPAEMTWKAGVDVVCFGGTKNGMIGAEAVVFFDPAPEWEFQLRRKRAGHLFSKHRYLSAQFHAYVQDGLWLEMAEAANAAARRLIDGLGQVEGVSFMYEPQANIVYADMPRRIHRRLAEAGAVYEVISDLGGADPAELLGSRMVCSWCTTDAEVDRFLDCVSG